MAKRLLIISSFWPSTRNSISGIFVVQQIEGLQRLYSRVDVLVVQSVGRSSRPLLPSSLGLNPAIVHLHSLVTFRFPERVSKFSVPFSLNIKWSGASLVRKLKLFPNSNEPFDGCLLHGARYLYLSSPRWTGLLQSPVGYVIHGIDYTLAKLANRQEVREKLIKASTGFRFIAIVGSPLKVYAEQIFISDSRLRLLPNGVKFPSVAEERPQIKSNSKTIILSISNLNKIKGIDDNLEALSILKARRPDIKFEYWVIGDGPERTFINSLVDKYCLRGNVSLLGRLEYEKTMRILDEIDIFSLPSWAEAFGIVYLEAMIRGKPVIGCRYNGAEDIILDGQVGYLIEPRDVVGLSWRLETLLSNGDLRSMMGVKGIKRASQFSWHKNARLCFELLGNS